MDFDVVIIGGGPAGTSCALRLGRAGKKVALIEKEGLGGICLNHGCIPSKTYLYAVELMEAIHKAPRHGVQVGEAQTSWEAMRKRKDMNVRMLATGLKRSLECAGVEVIAAEGIWTGDHNVTLRNPTAESSGGERTVTAQHIVLALGSKSLFPVSMQPGEHVISNREVLALETLPRDMVVIGGGVIGVEMASIFLPLGVQVTLLEKMDTLLPAQDREMTAHLKTALEKAGAKIYLGVEVLSATDHEGHAQVVYKNPDGTEVTLQPDKALVVIGRAAPYDLKAFEANGLATDGTGPTLNEYLQTSVPHVYMAGDAAFRNLTAYGAEREGECVAAHILGNPRTIDYTHLPVTVFSHPEIGQIGITEEEAQKRGIEVDICRSDYAGNPKAIIIGEREGKVKILLERATQKVIGVHVVGFQATELIHQAMLPFIQGMTGPQWRELLWSHPVLSEVLKAALENTTSKMGCKITELANAEI